MVFLHLAFIMLRPMGVIVHRLQGLSGRPVEIGIRSRPCLDDVDRQYAHQIAGQPEGGVRFDHGEIEGRSEPQGTPTQTGGTVPVREGELKPQRGGVTGDQKLGAVEAIALATQSCVGIVFKPRGNAIQCRNGRTHQLRVIQFGRAVGTHNPAVGAVTQGQMGAVCEGLEQCDLRLQRLGSGATPEQEVMEVIGATELQP